MEADLHTDTDGKQFIAVFTPSNRALVRIWDNGSVIVETNSFFVKKDEYQRIETEATKIIKKSFKTIEKMAKQGKNIEPSDNYDHYDTEFGVPVPPKKKVK